MTDSILSLNQVTKRFGTVDALKGISLDVKKGEFLTLLGPSGCGKTTTLRIIAGLETPDSGSVLLQGKDVTHWEPNKRNVNTVFQNYALFPHMDVFHNISYGLKLKKEKKSMIKQKVQEMLDLLQLSGYEKRMPAQLSGGQKQRVAIARMLMQQAPIMVFDDSLSAVDAETDARIRAALRDTLHSATVLLISHRVTTLMQADRILVLDGGRVSALGAHRELIDRPGIYRDIYDIQMRSDDRALVEEGGNA